jgi:predicted MFS family arabinose efflux permease
MSTSDPATRSPQQFPRFLAVAACFRFSDNLIVSAVPLAGGAVFGLGAREIGWMVAAQTSAWLLMSLPFGVVVDRLAPIRALGFGLILMAAGIGLIVGGVIAGHVLLFSVGTFICSAAVVMGYLSEGAILQRIIPPAGLPRANARLQIIQSSAMLLGPILMGWLIVKGQLLAAMLACLGLVAIGLALAGGMARQSPPPARNRAPVAEALEGLAFVAGQPLLRGIVACALFWNMAAFAMVAFFVPYALGPLGMSAAEIGTAQSLQGAGSMLAALAVGAILARSAPRVILALGPASSTVAAGLLLLAPLTGGFPTTAMLFFMMGFGPILWFVCQNTIRQLVTPQGLLGRVGAVIQLSIYGMRSAGALLGGQAADRFGYETAIWMVIALFALSTLTIPLSALGSLARMPDGASSRA